MYSGLWNGKWVAIKKISIKESQIFNIKPSLNKFIKEVNIISSLRHPNIILYMGASINQKDYYMISEYMNQGSLFDYIHVQKGRISEKDQLTIAYHIAIAIKYLHSRKILHCDLKSSNILIDNNWKVKISDFGLSRIKNVLTLNENRGRIGTPHWMAPEIMKGNMYSEASDVFSYGMIIWEIVTCEIPYCGLSQFQILGIVADCKKIVEIPKNINPILWKIIKRCLSYDVKERPCLDLIIKKLEKYINNSESNGNIST